MLGPKGEHYSSYVEQYNSPRNTCDVNTFYLISLGLFISRID